MATADEDYHKQVYEPYSDSDISKLFHKLWTQDSSDSKERKKQWQELEHMLKTRGIEI